jgi:hypothetical protein
MLEFLFVSTLASHTSVSEVANIARRARASNKVLGLTGVLIFDGLRFCEHLEGDKIHISNRLECIQRDPRHTDMKLLHIGPIGRRRFTRFSMGYALVEETEVLDTLSRLEGQAAINSLVALIPQLDLDA